MSRTFSLGRSNRALDARLVALCVARWETIYTLSGASVRRHLCEHRHELLNIDVAFSACCHREAIRRCGVRRPADLLPSCLEAFHARQVLRVLSNNDHCTLAVSSFTVPAVHFRACRYCREESPARVTHHREGARSTESSLATLGNKCWVLLFRSFRASRVVLARLGKTPTPSQVKEGYITPSDWTRVVPISLYGHTP